MKLFIVGAQLCWGCPPICLFIMPLFVCDRNILSPRDKLLKNEAEERKRAIEKIHVKKL
jgi:hypothetical protein